MLGHLAGDKAGGQKLGEDGESGPVGRSHDRMVLRAPARPVPKVWTVTLGRDRVGGRRECIHNSASANVDISVRGECADRFGGCAGKK
jgi:hypothetical protein